MILAFRFVGLLILAAAAHFGDGLAFAVLAAGALIGWRCWPWQLLLVPALGLGAYASEIYAHATGPGKLSGAMGNFFFESLVFGVLALIALVVARVVRERMGR